MQQSTDDVLLRERDGNVLIVTLNRPDRMNALGGGLPEALNEAWLDFRDDSDLQVMIITGAGDRAFCAGVDMRQNDERARASDCRWTMPWPWSSAPRRSKATSSARVWSAVWSRASPVGLARRSEYQGMFSGGMK